VGYDNPAGRLHSLLNQFSVTSQQGLPIIRSWSIVLGFDDEETTLLELARAAGLIPELRRQLISGGFTSQLTLFKLYEQHLLRAILSPGLDLLTTDARNVQLTNESLVALDAISSFLSTVAPEGTVPDEEARGSLTAQIHELMEEINNDRDLPPSVSQLLRERLNDVAWAIGHVRIGGPAAVQQATERLAGAVTLQVRHTGATKGLVTRSWRLAGIIWVAFTVMGPAVDNALESWGNVADRFSITSSTSGPHVPDGKQHTTSPPGA
jgi:hypothetical protein